MKGVGKSMKKSREILRRIAAVSLAASMMLGTVATVTAQNAEDAWESTISYANSVANSVQVRYTDEARTEMEVSNTQMVLTQGLSGDNKNAVSIRSAGSGAAWVENTMDAFVEQNGEKVYASKSDTDGRMNTTRLGYYYDEAHVRDLSFSLAGDEQPETPVQPEAPDTPSEPQVEVPEPLDLMWYLQNWGLIFSTNGISTPVWDTEKDALCFSITDATDPQIVIKNDAGLFSADEYDKIELQIQTNGSGLQLIWRDADNRWEVGNGISPPTDGTVTIDKPDTMNGMVTLFRIDTGNRVGQNIALYSVRLYSSTSGASLDLTPYYRNWGVSITANGLERQVSSEGAVVVRVTDTTDPWICMEKTGGLFAASDYDQIDVAVTTQDENSKLELYAKNGKGYQSAGFYTMNGTAPVTIPLTNLNGGYDRDKPVTLIRFDVGRYVGETITFHAAQASSSLTLPPTLMEAFETPSSSVTHNVSGPVRDADTGALTFTVTGADDPYAGIESAKPYFSTTEYNAIELDVQTSRNSKVQAYVKIGDSGWFNTGYYGVENGQRCTVVIPLTEAIRSSTGDGLKMLRLDFGDNSVGETMTIYSIKPVKASDVNLFPYFSSLTNGTYTAHPALFSYTEAEGVLVTLGEAGKTLYSADIYDGLELSLKTTSRDEILVSFTAANGGTGTAKATATPGAISNLVISLKDLEGYSGAISGLTLQVGNAGEKVEIYGLRAVRSLSAEKEKDLTSYLVSGSYGLNQCSNASYTDGVLTFYVENTQDPYINIRDTELFRARDYDSVEITLRTQMSELQLFLIAGPETNFNGRQVVNVDLKPGIWNTVVVPLDSFRNYTGSVSGIRLDVGGMLNERIEIQSIKAVNREEPEIYLDRTFIAYPDKLHEAVRFVAGQDGTVIGMVGTETRIPANNVSALLIQDANGEHSSLTDVDQTSIEYLALDISGAGVFGYIMPAGLENNGLLTIVQEGGEYVITRACTFAGTYDETESVEIYHRIYMDATHSFDAFRKEAYTERNPLTTLSVTSTDDWSEAKYLGYDAKTGSYIYTLKAVDFNLDTHRTYGTDEAGFKTDRVDDHFRVNASVTSDSLGRTVYLKTSTVGWGTGCIEAAAVLDENSELLPLPIEVCKNFGEVEEPFYDPKDEGFSNAIVPIVLNANETKQLSILNLYQNWGQVPLKQLSSIQYWCPYYHLSSGTTETNCITPFFIYEKNGTVLPDFRGLSNTPIWEGQPQHTHMGDIYIAQYETGTTVNLLEAQNTDIRSSGPVYADINIEYLMDGGKFKAEYEHMELPQTDETRTLYRCTITALEDVTFTNFKDQFSIFSATGRDAFYTKLGYLDSNNTCQVKEIVPGGSMVEYITLGTEAPYFDFFNINESNPRTLGNFGLIVKDSDITIDGQTYTGNFVLKHEVDGCLNREALTLDLGVVTLRAGDTITLDFVLLPWGTQPQEDDSNVRNVREDTCLNPYVLDVKTGTDCSSAFLPQVTAERQRAEFTISGGKNNAAIRVYGFESWHKPVIQELVDGKWGTYHLESEKNGYDGYQVYREEDGSYSFSFAIPMGEDGTARTFRVFAKQSQPNYSGGSSSAAVSEQPETSLGFVDVSTNAYHYDAVQWAVENGVTTGTDANAFSPDASCTRSQAVTFLWRAEGCPAPKSEENQFKDVTSNAYYYDAVLWAVERGITTGTGEDTFSPDSVCTRAQIVTFLWRLDGSDIIDTNNPFADVQNDDYFYSPVLWAVNKGVTTGTSAAGFSPEAPCTRAQIVTFLYRYKTGNP